MADSQKSGKMIRKITPASVAGEVGLDLTALPRPVESRVLYDLFGVISRVKQGQSQYGPWTKFLGEFEAVTPDGEVFISGQMMIPVLDDILFSKIAEMQDERKEDKASSKVTLPIAIRVGIKTAPKGKPSQTGYEWDIQPLLQTQPSNQIQQLKELAAKHAPALPAPKKDKK